MPKRTLVLIFVLLLVTVGLLYLALSPKQQTTTPPVTTSPTPTPVAQTKLFLSPNPLYISSSSGTLNVNIDTQENMVTAVQFEISYDPKTLVNVDVASPSANSFFTDSVVLLEKVDAQAGKISYAIGIPPTGKSVKGKGTVATINFRSLLTNGQTSVMFDPESQVTAEGVSGSVLLEGQGASVIYSPTSPTSLPSTRSATPTQ